MQCCVWVDMTTGCVQNGGNLPLNGTQFLVSSDLFTFSGIADATDGIPSLRTWAITHTERISEVCASPVELTAVGPAPSGA